jgi:hypothetical protein
MLARTTFNDQKRRKDDLTRLLAAALQARQHMPLDPIAARACIAICLALLDTEAADASALKTAITNLAPIISSVNLDSHPNEPVRRLRALLGLLRDASRDEQFDIAQFISHIVISSQGFLSLAWSRSPKVEMTAEEIATVRKMFVSGHGSLREAAIGILPMTSVDTDEQFGFIADQLLLCRSSDEGDTWAAAMQAFAQRGFSGRPARWARLVERVLDENADLPRNLRDVLIQRLAELAPEIPPPLASRETALGLPLQV